MRADISRRIAAALYRQAAPSSSLRCTQSSATAQGSPRRPAGRRPPAGGGVPAREDLRFSTFPARARPPETDEPAGDAPTGRRLTLGGKRLLEKPRCALVVSLGQRHAPEGREPRRCCGMSPTSVPHVPPPRDGGGRVELARHVKHLSTSPSATAWLNQSPVSPASLTLSSSSARRGRTAAGSLDHTEHRQRHRPESSTTDLRSIARLSSRKDAAASRSPCMNAAGPQPRAPRTDRRRRFPSPPRTVSPCRTSFAMPRGFASTQGSSPFGPEINLAALLRPAERRAQVLAIRVEATQQRHLLGPRSAASPARPAAVEREVARLSSLSSLARRAARTHIPDRFEHAEPRLVADRLFRNVGAVIEQRGESVEHVVAGDKLRPVGAEAAAEYRESSERLLLVVAEQSSSLDRGSKRAVTLGHGSVACLSRSSRRPSARIELGDRRFVRSACELERERKPSSRMHSSATWPASPPAVGIRVGFPSPVPQRGATRLGGRDGLELRLTSTSGSSNGGTA